MAEIKLYGSRLSPFVEKVARALQLKRLAFEQVDPKGKRGDRSSVRHQEPSPVPRPAPAS